METILDVRNLSVNFLTRGGGVHAVDGLSFSVAGGETVGIVGESGSGKTTAALTIMGLLPPQGRVTGGEIVLNGRDIARYSRQQIDAVRGPEMAMIFQDALAALDPTMTVGEQLCEAITAHLRMNRSQARQRAVQLLRDVGISMPEKRLAAYPHEFSGGMRQRVVIALALACNPNLILADEPTTALDVTIQRQILDLIKQLQADIGAAIVLITHDVGVVSESCDRVLVMYAGRVVESGTTEDVFEHPRHLYTAALLDSPSLDITGDRDKPINAIAGMPPDLMSLPRGCPFAPRCRFRTDICSEPPPLAEVAPNHWSACWNVAALVASEVSSDRAS